MIETLLSERLIELYKEDEFADCFTVDIIGDRQKVAVYIDADSGLSLGRCQRISRRLESAIEEHGWMQEKYTIEVSSPGLDRPLKLFRQYVKNVGRNVLVKKKDNSSIEGVLKEVNDLSILIQTDEKEHIIDFNDINETKVQVSFK